MKLSSTQIGSISENLVANELMIESGGRLSPFQPVADDDGIDVLIYDKRTGRALPLQIKSRTSTIKKRNSEERGNMVHFEVRKATLRSERHGCLLCVLLSDDLRATERSWLIPLSELPDVATEKESKFVIRANKQTATRDKYKHYQCKNMNGVAQKIIEIIENRT